MRNYYLLLIFQKYGCLIIVQLQIIYRNLGRSSVEKPVHVMVHTKQEDLDKGTQKQTLAALENCRACQFEQNLPKYRLLRFRSTML